MSQPYPPPPPGSPPPPPPGGGYPGYPGYPPAQAPAPAPGYGYPPPPPPPMQVRPKRSLAPWIALGCGGILVLGGILFWIVMAATAGPEQVVQTFLAATGRGDYGAAYETFSSGLKESQSFAEFSGLARDNAVLFDVQETTFNDRSVDSGTAHLAGHLTLKSGDKVPASFELAKESGTWKLTAYNIKPESATLPAAGPDQVVSEFLEATGRGDYSTAYKTFSTGLQQSQSYATFTGLARDNANLFEIRTTSFPQRSVDANTASLAGTLRLQGGDEIPASFELEKEGGEWKITAYNINSSS